MGSKKGKVEWMERKTSKFIGGKILIKVENWWIGLTYMREERERNYENGKKRRVR